MGNHWGGSEQVAEQAVTNPGKLDANDMRGGDSLDLDTVMGSGRSEAVHVLDALSQVNMEGPYSSSTTCLLITDGP